MIPRDKRILSFPPCLAPDARVLILGSMPGVESLRQAEYYAHPRNAFWPIISELLGRETPAEYEARRRLIRENRLALWDVCGSCEREGSLDQRIRDPLPNDFASLFAEHPGISFIFFNGAKAEELFRRLVPVPQAISLMRLPSTSPAHTLSYAEKLAAWRAVGDALDL